MTGYNMSFLLQNDVVNYSVILLPSTQGLIE